MTRPFSQVDVFAASAYLGNPVAVVLEASGLTDEEMQRIARWMNLSETTFVLAPTDPDADYRVRIYTPSQELAFAGHPTLGTCHAWLESGQAPRTPGAVMQECSAGLVRVRETDQGLAFAAPPPIRSGPVDQALVSRAADMLGLPLSEVVDSQWVDNGPGWMALLLRDADAVLALAPGFVDRSVGVVGAYPREAESAFEVRAFFPKDGATTEDPVTGSLNASLAGWLLASGRATAPYTVSQGTALGRAGRVHISTDAEGTIWTAGATVTCVKGTVAV